MAAHHKHSQRRTIRSFPRACAGMTAGDLRISLRCIALFTLETGRRSGRVHKSRSCAPFLPSWGRTLAAIAAAAASHDTSVSKLPSHLKLRRRPQIEMARVFFCLASALLVLAASSVQATLDPCTSNTKGKAPVVPSGCTAQKTSKSIQAAECAYNTRVSGKQVFAVFTTNHKYDKVYGAPYGDCTAYTCTGTPTFTMKTDADSWTFFWSSNGESSGVGTGCIRDPQTGVCGCENSDGTFIKGGTNCK